ncbi:RNA 2'-phosphotransferase [Acidovorax sp. PRC11]|uniref:RNA 2'-phosphotransferase n=1 Tax=Acidovorax sp. PRC11 TaxID=2962592 RepID=UPI0028823C4E|nr:RNA 2'-phosphotransferase [Acidovorax sp. PRC11]MDT0140818.1 RNA 2'-phosphotransferase [Acidovorax sp. PRC11]
MNNKQFAEISKFLSYVLRHEPQAIGLTLDREGWADIDALISAAAQHGRRLNRELLDLVVCTSEKMRFAVSEDGASIRAVQGHSTDSVSISFEDNPPPPLLYHGTATRFLESIRAQGLLPGARQHVHLTENVQTAMSVGQRYGKPVVLTIAAGTMHNKGIKFYQAQNGVWLIPTVPVQFLSESSG